MKRRSYQDTPTKKVLLSISPIKSIPEHHIKRHFSLASLQLVAELSSAASRATELTQQELSLHRKGNWQGLERKEGVAGFRDGRGTFVNDPCSWTV